MFPSRVRNRTRHRVIRHCACTGLSLSLGGTLELQQLDNIKIGRQKKDKLFLWPLAILNPVLALRSILETEISCFNLADVKGQRSTAITGYLESIQRSRRLGLAAVACVPARQKILSITSVSAAALSGGGTHRGWNSLLTTVRY